jgi:hypothetical protein
MSVSGAGNGASARRHQATGKLDLLDASSSLSNPNQHDTVLDSNHHNRIFPRGSVLVEIQATDPAAMIDLSIPKRWA